MDEYKILWTAGISLVGLAIACILYSLGGRDGKWKRRYVASFVIALSVCLSSFIMGLFNFYQLLCYPLLIVVFSMGYGVNE